MILKVVWSKEDESEEVFEISNYYSEIGYLEAAIGKNKTSLDREIIVNEGEVWTMSLPDAEHGENYWEEVIVLTDGGVELWKTKNLDLKLLLKEKAEVEI